MNFHLSFLKFIVGEKILDIGYAQKPNILINSKELYGIDMQKTEKPSNYKEIKCVNLNNSAIPYSDNFFDTVIITEVIEHVENPSYVLRECNRVLKNGGRLIISTPQANYLFTFIKNIIYSFLRINLDQDPGEHLSNWTILDFVRLLKKNSFEIKKILGLYIYLPYISIPVKSFPILSWQVVYICKKNGLPNEQIFTKDSEEKYKFKKSAKSKKYE